MIFLAKVEFYATRKTLVFIVEEVDDKKSARAKLINRLNALKLTGWKIAELEQLEVTDGVSQIYEWSWDEE